MNNTSWSWKDSPELMIRLIAAQNSPKNWNQDITTFAGFCDSAERLERHIAFYEERAALSTRYDENDMAAYVGVALS
jgi:hypothetical protein